METAAANLMAEGFYYCCWNK